MQAFLLVCGAALVGAVAQVALSRYSAAAGAAAWLFLMGASCVAASRRRTSPDPRAELGTDLAARSVGHV